MNLRPLFLALLACVAFPCVSRAADPGTVTSEISVGAPAAAELTSQPTLADALRWLNERYPPESLIEDDSEFFYEADDIVLDDVSGLLIVAYRSDESADSDWLAWLGLDEDLVVVLIEGVALK